MYMYNVQNLKKLLTRENKETCYVRPMSEQKYMKPSIMQMNSKVLKIRIVRQKYAEVIKFCKLHTPQ